MNKLTTHKISLVNFALLLFTSFLMVACGSAGSDTAGKMAGKILGLQSPKPIYEGTSNEITSVDFVLVLDAPVGNNQLVYFDYTTVDGISGNPAKKTDNDYVITSGTGVPFLKGESSQIISVPVNGDIARETDEDFLLLVSKFTVGGIVSAKRHRAIAIIRDDDVPPIIQSSFGVNIGEGNSGNSNLVVRVELDRIATEDSSVGYITSIESSDNATENDDYTTTSGTLSFVTGGSFAEILVPIIGDTDVEPDESFTITLSNIVGVGFEDADTTSISIKAIIKDDDGDSDTDGIKNYQDIDDDNNGFIDISNAVELNNMRHSPSGTHYQTSASDEPSNAGCPTGGCSGYQLVNDIDLSASKGSWIPIPSLLSELDGSDYTISNLRIIGTKDSSTNIAFISISNGNINNLNFDTVTIEGHFNETSSGAQKYYGTVVSNHLNGKMENVHVTNATLASGDFGPDALGGLIAISSGSSLVNSTFQGVISSISRDLTGEDLIGGLIGYTKEYQGIRSLITNSSSSGQISGGSGQDTLGGLLGVSFENATISGSNSTMSIVAGHGEDRIGGLVGGETANAINHLIIKDSYYEGTITGSPDSEFIGGISSRAAGRIRNSYANVTINGDGGNDNIGGLVGVLLTGAGGSITGSYATGTITGGPSDDRLGCLAGSNYSIISGSYATCTINGSGGSDIIGGLVGHNALTVSVLEYSYAESTIYGSDGFDHIGGLVGVNWAIISGVTYQLGTIQNSYSLSDITTGGNNNIGGIVGYNTATRDADNSIFGYGKVLSSYYSTDATYTGGTLNEIGIGKTLAQLKVLSPIAPTTDDNSECTTLVGGTWDTTDTNNPVCVDGSYEGWSTLHWSFGGQNGIGDTSILPTLRDLNKLDISPTPILCNQPKQPAERDQCINPPQANHQIISIASVLTA